MKLTPLHLKLLLHHYTHPEPWPHKGGCANEYEEQLRSEGLLQLAPPIQVDRDYLVTDKGRAHVEQLLTLPFPTQAWVNESGQVIQPEP